VLLTEAESGRTKMSFRSKPADEAGDFMDVNELAARFGGGGHVHAAGARLGLDLEAAFEALVGELEPR
ncbi:MAG: DHHA1 domain-containing protein, partial [Planctomycetota bacterium]|nr:DHHA1 domain-containing protein [Planctomycetota bacterium]